MTKGKIVISVFLSLLMHIILVWYLAGEPFMPTKKDDVVLPVNLVEYGTLELAPEGEPVRENPTYDAAAGKTAFSPRQIHIYQEYVQQVRRKIQNHWQYTPEKLKANQGATTRIIFFIDRSGSLLRPFIETSSGLTLQRRLIDN